MSNKVLLLIWRNRWNSALLRFLRSRVRSDDIDIDDLAQETYLRLLRSQDLRDVRNPEAYLIRVAAHVAAEWRQSHVSSADQKVDLEVLVDEVTPQLTLEQNASYANLERELSKLAPMMRTTLWLRLVEDMAYKDIAAALDLSERQVKRYLIKGFDHLRQTLDL